MRVTPPWPIDGPEVQTQIRWIVFRLEGGDRVATRVTKAPSDRGGETIAGLTWRCYSEDYLRMPEGKRCPIEQFQSLTLDDVVHVLMEVFVLRTGLWKILDARLRLAVVDEAIASGPTLAIKNLQRALGVQTDGQFGPITERAANAADADAVREAVIDGRSQRLVRVVVADATQLANLLGWIARAGQVLRWRASASRFIQDVRGGVFPRDDY